MAMTQVKCRTGSSGEEDDKSDLEVASVLSKEMKSEPADSGVTVSPLKRFTPKYNYSPFRPSTVMTNISRGNIRTLTPSLGSLNIFQMAAQGELIMLESQLQETDVNSQDEQGFTPLIWAAANNQLLTVEYLLANGADCHLCGKNGENALLFASSNGHDRVVQLLLGMGMDVNCACQKGHTALLYAAFNNQLDCVKALLEWGADITHQNCQGQTALDIGVSHGHKEVQRVIEQHILSLWDPL